MGDLKHKHPQSTNAISQEDQLLLSSIPASSSAVPLSNMDAHIAQAIADDEKYARELQAELEKGEHQQTAAPFGGHPPGGTELIPYDDEALAKFLRAQEEFDPFVDEDDFIPPPPERPRKKSKPGVKKLQKPAAKLIDAEVLDMSEDATRVCIAMSEWLPSIQDTHLGFKCYADASLRFLYLRYTLTTLAL